MVFFLQTSELLAEGMEVISPNLNFWRNYIIEKIKSSPLTTAAPTHLSLVDLAV